MLRSLLPVSALLLGSALLLFAGGVNGLILPVRGTSENFSAFSLGLLGTGWAVGYVSGCLLTPGLVANTGHIRSFAVMAAVAAVAILSSLLFLTPWAWIPLRALSGFCFAGAAMIVESWLSERTAPGDRGRVFGLYTMVNLVASTAGQMSLTLGPTDTHLYFVLGAILYSLALLPVAISTSATPKPLVTVRLDLRALWRNSPVALFAVFMVGMSNGAFGTLAAVYADGVGITLTGVALFSSMPILAGALAQIPVGLASDKLDRRIVLLAIAVVAIGADALFIWLSPEDQAVNMALACLYGAAVFSMYPVIIAHANDHAADGTFIQTSGGLLMVFGLGSIVGPLLAGVGMSQFGGTGLFMVSLLAHVLIVLFTLYRIGSRAAVPDARKGNFQAAPPGRALTPETAVLAAEEGAETRPDRRRDPAAAKT